MEFIKSIPGPTFLLIFAVWAVIVIIVSRRFTGGPSENENSRLEPTKLTPLQLAFLAGGVKNALNVTMFKLLNAKKIELSDENSKKLIKMTGSATNDMDAAEHYVMDMLKSQARTGFFFTQKKFKDGFESAIKPETQRLVNEKLVMDGEVLDSAKFNFRIALLVLMAPAILKLYLGIVNDKPVSFLVMLILLSFFLMIAINRPIKYKLTKLGKQIVTASKQRFEFLKRNNAQQNSSDDNFLLYGVATFGLLAFAGTEASALNHAFESQRVTHTNTSTSDTSSGCSTGCSGSSCSGGSSCSSGCGGCGGGD